MTFPERRESIPGGSGENIPVFDAPEKPQPIKTLPIPRSDDEKCTSHSEFYER
jgi:hypothetical protein